VLIENLIATHNELRNHSSIDAMVSFVEKGGFFTKNALKEFAVKNKTNRVSPLVQISKFEDKVEYVHDGHHRVVSCWLAGRFILDPSECELGNWTYQRYMTPNIETNWFTPFDPRTQARIPDFSIFKHEAMRRKVSGENHEQIITWILENTDLYRTKKKLNTIEELSRVIKS